MTENLWVIECVKMEVGYNEWREEKEDLQKDSRKFCKSMDIFTVLIVVMVSWMCTDVRIYQIVYLCICSLLYINFTSVTLQNTHNFRKVNVNK